jgi:hypothetical protein
MPSKSQAQQLIEKADKRANSSTGWFGSATGKFEEAGDLYQQAANQFKIDRQFREAGDAYAREAECREKQKEISDAANAWWNAAKAYKQGYPDRECSLLCKQDDMSSTDIRIFKQLLFRPSRRISLSSLREVAFVRLPTARRRLAKSTSRS